MCMVLRLRVCVCFVTVPCTSCLCNCRHIYHRCVSFPGRAPCLVEVSWLYRRFSSVCHVLRSGVYQSELCEILVNPRQCREEGGTYSIFRCFLKKKTRVFITANCHQFFTSIFDEFDVPPECFRNRTPWLVIYV